MKKALCLAAGLVLSVAMLTGCGAPKIEDVVDKMYDTKMDSYTAEMSFDVNVNIKADGEKMPIKASGSFNVEQQGADMKEATAHIDGSVKYDLLGFMKDSNKIEAYLSAEDEEATVYYSIDGDDWYYTTGDMSDAGVDEKLVGKLTDASKEFWYTGSVDAKTEKVGGEDCYVITIDGTAADCKPVVDVLTKNVDEFADLMDEMDVDFEAIAQYFPVKVKAYASKKNGYMMGYDLDMSGVDFEGLCDELDMDMEDLGDAMGVELESVTVDSLTISMTYSNVNNTEVSIDKKVTKNAVEAGGSFDFDSDDYDWEDDYDYEDDDYDWEDEYEDDDYDWEDEDDYSSDYTIEDYLNDNPSDREDLESELGDDVDFTVDGNEMIFTMYLPDEDMSDEEFDAAVDAMDDAMGDMLEETFESILEQLHDETGIYDTITVTFEMYGETSGKFIWSDSYSN